MAKTVEDNRTYAELEAAVLAGDSSISPEALSTARERDRLAELTAQAEELAAEREAEAVHQAALDQLRQDICALPDDGARIGALAQQAEASLIELVRAVQARERAMTELMDRARQLGISESRGYRNSVKPGGIGWRRDQGGAGAPELRADGRVFRSGSPYALVDRLFVDVRNATGLKPVAPGTVSRNVPPAIGEQIDALETEAPAPMRRVRVRHLTGMKAGTVREMDLDAAEHLGRRGQIEFIDR